jgi:hypothetical protein
LASLSCNKITTVLKARDKTKKTGKNLILFSKAVQNKPPLKKFNYRSYLVTLRLLIQNYER